MLLIRNDDGSLSLTSAVPGSEAHLDPHKIFAAQGPDGVTCNLYMIFTDGANKGKIFMVMPLNYKVSKDDINSLGGDEAGLNKINQKLGFGNSCHSTVLKTDIENNALSDSTKSRGSMEGGSMEENHLISSSKADCSILTVAQDAIQDQTRNAKDVTKKYEQNEEIKQQDTIGEEMIANISRSESQDIRPIFLISNSMAKEMWKRNQLTSVEYTSQNNTQESVSKLENSSLHQNVEVNKVPQTVQVSNAQEKNSVKVSSPACLELIPGVLPLDNKDIACSTKSSIVMSTLKPICSVNTGKATPMLGSPCPVKNSLSSSGLKESVRTSMNINSISKCVSLLGASERVVSKSQEISSQAFSTSLTSLKSSSKAVPSTIPVSSSVLSQLHLPSKVKSIFYLLPPKTLTNSSKAFNENSKNTSDKLTLPSDSTIPQTKVKLASAVSNPVIVPMPLNNIMVSSNITTTCPEPFNNTNILPMTTGMDKLQNFDALQSKSLAFVANKSSDNLCKKKLIKSVIIFNPKSTDNSSMNLKSIYMDDKEADNAQFHVNKSPDVSEISSSTLKIGQVFSLKPGGTNVLSPALNEDSSEGSVIDDKLVKACERKILPRLSLCNIQATAVQDHLSNFESIILPDNAIANSQLFTPCFTVLENMRFSHGKLTGLTGLCSVNCRQNFLKKYIGKVDVRTKTKLKVKIGPRCAKFRKKLTLMKTTGQMSNSDRSPTLPVTCETQTTQELPCKSTIMQLKSKLNNKQDFQCKAACSGPTSKPVVLKYRPLFNHQTSNKHTGNPTAYSCASLLPVQSSVSSNQSTVDISSDVTSSKSKDDMNLTYLAKVPATLPFSTISNVAKLSKSTASAPPISIMPLNDVKSSTSSIHSLLRMTNSDVKPPTGTVTCMSGLSGITISQDINGPVSSKVLPSVPFITTSYQDRPVELATPSPGMHERPGSRNVMATLTNVSSALPGNSSSTCSMAQTGERPYFLLKIENKNQFVPCKNTNNVPKALVLHNYFKPFHGTCPSLSKYGKLESSCAISTTKTKNASYATQKPVVREANSIDDGPPDLGPPITASVMKDEPTTMGYGDENKSRVVTVKIKQERLDRGYPDEPKVVNNNKRLLLEYGKGENSPGSTKMPKLEKIEPKLSLKERIESLKKQMKEQEKAVDLLRQRRGLKISCDD